MQREKGWRAPGSGKGFPHGKDAKQARRERAYARGAQRPKSLAPTVSELGQALEAEWAR